MSGIGRNADIARTYRYIRKQGSALGAQKNCLLRFVQLSGILRMKFLIAIRAPQLDSWMANDLLAGREALLAPAFYPPSISLFLPPDILH